MKPEWDAVMHRVDALLPASPDHYIPLRLDKRPVCHGHSSLSCDRGWCWSRATGYGVPLAGLFVVDVDDRGVLDDYWPLFKALSGRTLTVRTPRPGGGWHLYFQGALKERRYNSTDRFQIKSGASDYVVGPGSSSTDGLYKLRTAVPPLHRDDEAATDLLFALVDEARPDPAKKGRPQGVVRTLEAGDRNSALASIAGGLVRFSGLCDEAVEAALLAHNLHACNPPLPEAEVHTTILQSTKKWRS